MENLTPMMRQYNKIKLENPGILLFFRLGDFYEMFYEDAVLASRELEITLTSRNTDKRGNPIPMCGIPHHAVASYLAKLLKKGFKVAICEQVEDPRQAKGIVRREVTRILTPGTAIEESVLDLKENNYLASLVGDSQSVAASFLDVSTGEFWIAQFEGEDSAERLEEELSHFKPTEVVFPESSEKAFTSLFPAALKNGIVKTAQPDWTFNRDFCIRILLQHFKVSSLAGFGIADDSQALLAAGALLNYVQQTQKSDLRHIGSLSLLEQKSYLRMDESTVRNLELIRRLDGSKKWTLLAAIDDTKTAMGARLLRSWMLRPSMNLSEIQARLDAVEELTGSVIDLEGLRKVLASIHDIERLLSRVTMGTANPRDLLSLRDSLMALPELVQAVSQYSSELLRPEIDRLEDVVDLLLNSISEDAPVVLTEGRIIREGYDEKLDDLREISSSGKAYIAQIEIRERERTGIPSLKVKYNRVFGYFIEVTKTHLDSVPEDYIRKQTLASSERYINAELKEYEEKVLGAEERIIQLEKDLFLQVRSTVADQAARIQRVARIIACLDVLASFAEVARRNHYVRPQIDESLSLSVRSGRHPVLELQSSDPFVPNDLDCDANGDQMMILTGPNMGGKSTYLRQTALMVVMAQMGSFVPSDEARIGLVDRLFTRVGASDNLALGRSTFMVEMIETARILNTATPRSLILLDEVGRGTATFDGLSIAWAVAEYLIREQRRKARTLFATHYQELTGLESLYEGVRNYCVTARESGRDILFFHRVMPGIANKSYGIQVARLAGVPAGVIERAQTILARLERKQLNLTGRNRPSLEIEELQKALF
jgi:DNA mismatch repair protein MutS